MDEHQLVDRLLYAEQGLRATGCAIRGTGRPYLVSPLESIVRSDPDPTVTLGPLMAVRDSLLSGEEVRADVLL